MIDDLFVICCQCDQKIPFDGDLTICPNCGEIDSVFAGNEIEDTAICEECGERFYPLNEKKICPNCHEQNNENDRDHMRFTRIPGTSFLTYFA